MRLCLALFVLLIGTAAEAQEVVWDLENAEVTTRFEHGNVVAVDCCMLRVDATPAVELVCVHDAPAGVPLSATAPIEVTPGRDGVIRGFCRNANGVSALSETSARVPMPLLAPVIIP